MKKTGLLLIFIALITSCGNNNKIKQATTFNYDSFKETHTLKATQINHFEDLNEIHRVHIMDTFLVVTTSPFSEQFVKVYTLDGKKVTDLIPAGRGPNEMTQMPTIGYSAKNDQFWVFDMSIKAVLIADSIHTIKDPKFRRIHLNSPEIATHGFISDDCAIIVPAMSDSERFSVYDLNGKFIDTRGEYPDFELDRLNTKRLQSDLWNGYWDYDENSETIVIGTQVSDLISIYKKDGTLVKMLHGPDQRLPIYRASVDGSNGKHSTIGHPDEGMNAYINIVCKDNKIWALYLPYKFEDQKPEKCELYTFTMDGTPLERYILPENIHFFDVDIKNKTIWGNNLETGKLYNFKY